MTWLDALTLETVIVQTTHGPSVKGLKSAVYDDCIVLKQAMLLEDPPEVLNGEIAIMRERVLLIQIVSGASE